MQELYGEEDMEKPMKELDEEVWREDMEKAVQELYEKEDIIRGVV